MTKELLAQFKKIGSQEDVKDPIVVAHFFNPVGAGDWWMTSFDSDDGIFFGFAHILEGEWGSSSLEELESYKSPMGLGIERDLHWEPKPFSKCDVKK